MDRANKAMRQKFKRVQQNLGLSEKRDALQQVQAVDQRNQKIISAVHTYKKNVANSIKTGLREDQMEKRKKKTEEFSLLMDLASEAKDLEAVQSTCLSRVMRHISVAVNKALDERIHLEQSLERRVLDGLAKYIDVDKSLGKSKEKLNNMIIDVDIAKKALNSKHEESRIQELQDQLDTTSLKLDSHKDATITDIYVLASKEQEIASVFSSFVEEQIEYHRSALLAYENALPEILRDIANAQPHPVFGVDLEEHLRHSGRRISLVMEKCCTMLRQTGFSEKGLFRVNGNNTKIRRMKAAFDAGQIDNDADEYFLDPHSICSVLKGYLRELPEPLLTTHLYQDWATAIRLEGQSRVNEIDRILSELPSANKDNLTYLIQFLTEMLNYENVTMMNTGNLSIVFGPNLTGSAGENDNITGSRVVETLLQNAQHFFGCTSNSLGTSHRTDVAGSSASYSSESDSSLLARSMSSPSQNNHSLSVDTQQLKNKSDYTSISPNPSQYSISPSPNRIRPKQPAPQPPSYAQHTMSQSVVSLNSIRSDLASAVLIPSVVSVSSPAPAPQIAEKEPGLTLTYAQPVYASSPVTNNMYTTTQHFEQNQGIDISELENLEREVLGSDSKSPSLTSQDSMNEYAADTMTRSMREKKPHRPPPPIMRTASAQIHDRPMSYHSAVGASRSLRNESVISLESSAPVQVMTPSIGFRTVEESLLEPTPAHRTPIVHDAENRTLITLETPERVGRGVKPPLPTKPKTEEMTKL